MQLKCENKRWKDAYVEARSSREGGTRYRILESDPNQRQGPPVSIPPDAERITGRVSKRKNAYVQVWSFLGVVDWAGEKKKWLQRTGRNQTKFCVPPPITQTVSVGSPLYQVLGSTLNKPNQVFVSLVESLPVTLTLDGGRQYKNLIYPLGQLVSVTKQLYVQFFSLLANIRQLKAMYECQQQGKPYSRPKWEKLSARTARQFSLRFIPLLWYVDTWSYAIGYEIGGDAAWRQFYDLWRDLYILQAMCMVKKQRERSLNARKRVLYPTSMDQLKDLLLSPANGGLGPNQSELEKGIIKYSKYRDSDRLPTYNGNNTEIVMPGPPPSNAGSTWRAIYLDNEFTFQSIKFAFHVNGTPTFKMKQYLAASNGQRVERPVTGTSKWRAVAYSDAFV